MMNYLQIIARKKAAASSGPSIRSISLGNSLPAGAQDGDLIIIMAMSSSSPLTGPGGFTQLMNTSNNPRTGIWYKVASSEPSSYTVTNATEYRVIAVQGVDGTTPVRHSSEGEINILTSFTFTPLTLTRDGLLIIYFAAQADNAPAIAITSGTAAIQTSMYTSTGVDRGFAMLTMDNLQNIGYSEDVVISKDSATGRFAKIAIQPPV